MNYLDVITMLKFSFLGLSVIFILYRYIRILLFNSQHEEPVSNRMLTPFNNMEVEGTDLADRRIFMKRMNRLIAVAYICIVLLGVSMVLPRMLHMLGIAA